MKLFNDLSKRFPFFGVFVVLFPFACGAVYGQGSATYPYVSPTAGASGMTTGLENGSTSGTMNMMQVRAAAQEAERAAAAAAMARTAESAIEEQSLKTALEKARATRQAKIDASERLKWQRVTAYNAYNRVSSSEISTWKDPEGNVRVGRGLPADFVESVQKEQAARAASEPKKKDFSPIKNISNKVTQAVGGDEPVESGLSGPKPLPQEPVAAPREKTGRFNLSPPKLNFPKIRPPKIFSKNSETPPAAAPPQQQYATAPPQQQPQMPPEPRETASASATSAAPASGNEASPKPVKIQQSRSASEMVNADAQNAGGNGNPLKSVGGLFSRNKNDSPPASDSRKFSFRKKQPESAAVVSSGLFPAGTAPESAASAPAPSGNRTIVSLPSSQPEPKKKRFSLPRPKISAPKAMGGGGDVSPTSVVNRYGNSFYVVNSQAQFMKYGDSPTETSITAVRPGTLVMMTKPGAEWATVQLSDGSTGIIRTKNLRGAAANEVPAN
ncbi:MAG: hypothetical protein P1V20_01000 [Verrucomicrobiales bacterium]|nr:hypothetical protein [Verrucomicrobiales bacterium]